MKSLTVRVLCVIALGFASTRGVMAQESGGAWVRDIGAPCFVAVVVEDVDRSVAWYTTVFALGGRGGSKADDGTWRIENLGNEFFEIEIIRDDRAQSAGRDRGIRKFGFRVPDVGTVADRVEGATGTRPRVVEDERFGVRILQLKDPDGNTIQLSSPIQ